MINIDDLTLGQLKEIQSLTKTPVESQNPFIGKRVLVRTYSAGVHIGTLITVSPDSTQCHLKNALRLWKWEGGGLSLSAVASSGIKGGRLNKTQEIYLTNAIEYIPTTEAAEKTYENFIEF